MVIEICNELKQSLQNQSRCGNWYKEKGKQRYLDNKSKKGINSKSTSDTVEMIPKM
jgi:hypothetical protein